MAQKWSNISNNMLREYLPTNSPSEIQNITADCSQPSSLDSQGSNASHMMIPTNHFIVPSNGAKKHCLSNSDCNISENTCSKISEREKSSFGEYQTFKEKCPQNTCFVCLCQTEENDFVSIKESSKYSHAPLIVLLMDVLGYKLELENLHSQAMCRPCFQLIDTIDELQQTLTESKTDLRTKFLESLQKLKLKYPRTDKILKTKCLHCVQSNHLNSKKKKRNNRISKEKNNFMRNTKMKLQVIDESGSDEEIIHKDHETLSQIDSESNHSNASRSCESSDDLFCLQQSQFSIIFDTDPVYFSPDEKLKAGYIKNDDRSQVVYCCYCSARYDISLSLKMHVRVYHMPIIVYDNEQGTTEMRYRIGMKLQSITRNEIFVEEKPFCCLFCLSSFKLQSSLQDHFRENHSPYKPYQCLECKECFRSAELSRHKVCKCPVKKNSKF